MSFKMRIAIILLVLGILLIAIGKLVKQPNLFALRILGGVIFLIGFAIVDWKFVNFLQKEDSKSRKATSR